MTVRPAPARPVAAVLVVVPARDEQDRIGRCVASVLAAGEALRRHRPGVVTSLTLVLDRCADATGEHAAAAAGPGGVDLVTSAAGLVGQARRTGVDHAVRAHAVASGRRAAEPADDVLLVSTDADCSAPRDWLIDLVSLAESGGGHDLVQGEVRPDPLEMGVAALERWQALHPAGRGSLHGANLAVRLRAYRRAGGWPPVAEQEDLLLVRRLRAQGAAVTGGTSVTTSGRRAGRVPGGFAGYLRGLDRQLTTAHPAGPPGPPGSRDLGPTVVA